MNKKHLRTLTAIFARPVSGAIKWSDIEEREGSRIGVVLFGEVQVYHRPHPQKETDKDAVISIKKWLERNGVKA